MLSEDELRLFRKLYGNCEVTLRYFILTKKNPYISCFITDFQDISSWNCTEPVFISAQTGTGKNYFIQHTLVNYVNQQNIANNFYGKILLLSNRVALTRQGKKQLAGNLIDVVGDNKPFKKMTGYTDEGLDNYTNFNIVEVLSYHQLYNRLLIPEECEKLNKRNFKYIIFDECHFFTSDATFNRNTQFILRHCIETFKDSIRIYMSATLEEAFSPIIRAESKFGTNTKISGPVHCLYYYFARNYNYINEPINVYSDLMSLPEYIQGRSPDKWIMFVSSKKDGRSLVEKLHEQGIKAVFLTADSKETSSKEYTTYKGIVEEEKFPQQVLVATSVLDNGINIKDPDVKHIVIDVLDRTEFVQMLGRVRISGDQEINLYIRHYSDENIKKFFIDDVKALLARLRTDFIKNNVRTEYYQNLPDSKYKKEHLFRLTAGKRQFKYNKCAIYKLLERTITFLRVLNVNTPNCSINLDSLGEFRAERARIYQEYLQKTEFKGSELLRDQICQILEVNFEKHERMRKLMYGGRFSSEEDFEEEIPRLNFDGATRFTFLHYLFRVLIPDSVAKSYFDNVSEQIYSSESSDYDLGFYDNPFDALWNHWRFLSTNNKLNFYQKLYDLKEYISSNDNFPQYEEENEYISKAIRESKRVFHYYDSLLNLTVSEIPILTEQAHWIERNYTRVSDFHYLDEERAKLPTEEEISAVIEKNSITLDEFKASTNENKRNVSFKNLELLQSKGSPIKLLNEDYQKIFDFFSSIYGERLTASNLKEKFDRDPFVVKGNSYTLEIVRGTKAQDQHKYCIFVKR